MSIQLKVKPAELESKAQQISVSVKNIKKQFQVLEGVVKGSRNYWEGSAEKAHQRYYKDISEDADDIIKRLGEHPVDLLKMAGIYKEADAGALEKGSTLPDNVIV